MTKVANNTDPTYHYDLQTKNRATVRAQGQAINRALKTLKKIASSASIPAPLPQQDDEPTQQYVTIPRDEPANLLLKTALEDAAEEKRKSDKPPPATPRNGASHNTSPKKKRWFNWAD